MKNLKMILCRRVSFLLVLFVCAANITPPVKAANQAQTVQTEMRRNDIHRGSSYNTYRQQHSDLPSPQTEIPLTNALLESEKAPVKSFDDRNGVLLEENKTITWEADIEQSGWYSLYAEYYIPEGIAMNSEIQLAIDGAVPFAEADYLLLRRIWKNRDEVFKKDSQGNQSRPQQVEILRWQSAFFRDNLGTYSGYYQFYFDKGLHTVSLRSQREAVCFASLVLKQKDDIESYDETEKKYKEENKVRVAGEPIVIEAEAAAEKSDRMLAPFSSRSSAALSPKSGGYIKINVAGGSNWVYPTQTFTYSFNVKNAGLYAIGIKALQNMVRGLPVQRSLLVDGVLPFSESEFISFEFGRSWQNVVAGGDEKPYLYYFSEGQHTITLDIPVGDMSDTLGEADDVIYQLNAAYREFFKLVGNSPDSYRDYQFELYTPDALKILTEQSDALRRMADGLYEITGIRGGSAETVTKLLVQLERMLADTGTIAGRLTQLKDNIAALSEWVIESRKQPLILDYLVLLPENSEMKPPNAGFLKNLAYQTELFVSTFLRDYSFGSAEKEAVTVWLPLGRDQASIIQELVNEMFTPDKGIKVNLKLVGGDVLLPATVAGKGPDVALQQSEQEPVNFALRRAAFDLSSFDDFDDIAKRFQESAMTPLRYANGAYGLPETQTFPMLFVRTDVFSELDIAPPGTWTEFIEAAKKIQKNNMEVGMGDSSTVQYSIFLMQNGGAFYSDDGKTSAFNTENAISAFSLWTKLYTAYRLPVSFNFVSRFRTAEMPMAVMDYSIFNTLSVSAPEIRGLWRMYPLPGTPDASGSVHREAAGTITASVLLQQSKKTDAAWEFLKWWTSADVQEMYGRRLEEIMGLASRYATANTQALSKLPWTFDDRMMLQEQLAQIKGIPQVAGGYFTSRHLDNAFKRVVNTGGDPREILGEYTEFINDELADKQQEFNRLVKE